MSAGLKKCSTCSDDFDPRLREEHVYTQMASVDMQHQWAFRGVSDENEKRIYVRTPPELNDGEHWCPVSMDELAVIPELLREFVENWTIECVEAGRADEITLKLCVMTPAEVAALPDI